LDQLGHRPRIAVGGVEHGHTLLAGIFQIYLVDADAKTTDGLQFFCSFQYRGRNLGLGPDTE